MIASLGFVRGWLTVTAALVLLISLGSEAVAQRPEEPAPPSSTGITDSTLGGSSAATSALVLRSMKGVMRARSCAMRVLSPCFSMGVRNTSLKRCWLPRNPGIRKWNRLQISPR